MSIWDQVAESFPSMITIAFGVLLSLASQIVVALISDWKQLKAEQRRQRAEIYSSAVQAVEGVLIECQSILDYLSAVAATGVRGVPPTMGRVITLEFIIRRHFPRLQSQFLDVAKTWESLFIGSGIISDSGANSPKEISLIARSCRNECVREMKRLKDASQLLIEAVMNEQPTKRSPRLDGLK